MHEQPFENRALPERQQRLGQRVGERAQSRAETADENYGVHAARDLLARVDEECDVGGSRRLIDLGAVRSKDERNGETIAAQAHCSKVGD